MLFAIMVVYVDSFEIEITFVRKRKSKFALIQSILNNNKNKENHSLHIFVFLRIFISV